QRASSGSLSKSRKLGASVRREHAALARELACRPPGTWDRYFASGLGPGPTGQLTRSASLTAEGTVRFSPAPPTSNHGRLLPPPVARFAWPHTDCGLHS